MSSIHIRAVWRRWHRQMACLMVVGCLSAAIDTAAAGQDYHVRRLATGFHIPVYATTAPGDDNRIFVVQLGGVAGDETDGSPVTSGIGRIRIYDRTTGTILDDDFLAIPDTDLTDNPGEPEVGLWSMAFHPDYQNNGKFYVNVAVDNGGVPIEGLTSPFSSHLREYQVSDANPNIADPTPSKTLFQIVQPDFNHNGSWLGFNPIANDANDNKQYLYITQGDGGRQHDPGQHGQNTNTLLGAVMRIDVDSDSFPGDNSRNYGIPESNPFVDVSGADEIWSYGLRNPWRASFDLDTGDFWIGDVGQNTYEEIDFQAADNTGGDNYGWRLREGFQATPTGGIGGARPAGNVDPVYDFLHGGLGGNPDFTGNSVVGGYLYRGPVEAFQGLYIFADTRSNGIWSFNPANPIATVRRINDLFTPDQGSINYITSFGEDNDGNLLIVDGDGELYQLMPGPVPIRSDLDGDGAIGIGDWIQFLQYNGTEFPGLTIDEAVARGDLDNDHDNDYFDFRIFRSDYDEANGAGAFALLTSVPEPSTLAASLLWIACALCCRRISR